MKHYYRNLKIICVVADMFIFACLTAVLVSLILSMQYEQLTVVIIISFIAVAVISFIEILLISYYKDIVIDVECKDDKIIVKTNKTEYTLQGESFTKVQVSNGRTYLFCNDGENRKKFTYIMKYSPFKTYHLNMDELKAHMPCAYFDI